MIVFPIAGAALLSVILVLTVFVAAGAPLGEYTMGGKYSGVLPKAMRCMSAASVLIQLAAIIDILSVGRVISLGISMPALRVIGVVLAVYFLINTGMNLCSRSKKEKYMMTPLSLLTSICFFVTLFI